jgi:hypothetical protein
MYSEVVVSVVIFFSRTFRLCDHQSFRFGDPLGAEFWGNIDLLKQVRYSPSKLFFVTNDFPCPAWRVVVFASFLRRKFLATKTLSPPVEAVPAR